MNAFHGNRASINVFDVLNTFPRMGVSITPLLRFVLERRVQSTPMGAMSSGGRTKLPSTFPAPKCLLRASGDGEDEDEHVLGSSRSAVIAVRLGDQAARPPYISDIYPPFPRSYTFKQTIVLSVV